MYFHKGILIKIHVIMLIKQCFFVIFKCHSHILVIFVSVYLISCHFIFLWKKEWQKLKKALPIKTRIKNILKEGDMHAHCKILISIEEEWRVWAWQMRAQLYRGWKKERRKKIAKLFLHFPNAAFWFFPIFFSYYTNNI